MYWCMFCFFCFTLSFSVLVHSYAMYVFMYISGQVLSRPNIEEIIKFAKEENLFLMADEVKEIILWNYLSPLPLRVISSAFRSET